MGKGRRRPEEERHWWRRARRVGLFAPAWLGLLLRLLVVEEMGWVGV